MKKKLHSNFDREIWNKFQKTENYLFHEKNGYIFSNTKVHTE